MSPRRKDVEKEIKTDQQSDSKAQAFYQETAVLSEEAKRKKIDKKKE